jgi:Zn-dependent protease with chaperone function
MPENNESVRARRILKEISPASWEHPADRAALAALRRVPVFDQVLRALFGYVGEKPIRLAFQANAVRVGERQFPKLHRRYLEVLETLDAPQHYDLFVSQTPLVNAGAYGMDKPFIVMNSGSLELLNDEEMTYLLGHELGHILSGHVLYRTMLVLLINLAQMGFPVVGIAARLVLPLLLEWSRKSELSSDRAGLLAGQNPTAALTSMMKLAGGAGHGEFNDEMALNEFLIQADEYRKAGDIADSVFKVLNLMATTHPFHVLRAAELRDWVEGGSYDRILRGEYRRHTDESTPYQEDLAAAASSYRADAKDVLEQVSEAAKKMRDSVFKR